MHNKSELSWTAILRNELSKSAVFRGTLYFFDSGGVKNIPSQMKLNISESDIDQALSILDIK